LIGALLTPVGSGLYAIRCRRNAKTPKNARSRLGLTSTELEVAGLAA
jgi:hypothetical protein